jgi:hypothetical protein
MAAWYGIDAKLVHDAVGWALENGRLISFTLTSDGGAVQVTILEDGKPQKRWFSSSEDGSEALQDLEEYFDT